MVAQQRSGAQLLQRYDYLFRSTQDGILIASEGRLQHVNPAAAAMLTVPAEDLVGQTPAQAFPMNPALLNLFSREGEQTLDVRLPRRRLAAGMATTLEDGARIVLLQDVTEKRNLESRRESLVKAMAHDLRNPISAIGGFADLISKFGDLNEDQLKFLTRIRQTTNKLYDVAGSLVELAWIEAGMPLAHEPIRLPEIIARAIDRVRAQARQKQIVIATSVQDPMPVIMGDPDRLSLVIYNLLHNALVYSEPEKMVVVHAWEHEREVYCSVADRGYGIADDELDLVFDRMYRSRDERVRDTPGGGVGLTLARTIITRHGGDIWASSNLGQGSTFTFVLPTVAV